jgi:hypothetical protein
VKAAGVVVTVVVADATAVNAMGKASNVASAATSARPLRRL